MEENLKEKTYVEYYRQAHETRRRWESYIWQYGFLITALSAVFYKWTDIESETISYAEKIVLTLVNIFVIAIFMNIYRARVLMKILEKSIKEIHEESGFNIPTIPLELNAGLKKIQKLSSTKIAVYSYLIAVISFTGLTFYAWICM